MKGKMLLAGLLCSLSAQADDLAKQVESFIKSRYGASQVKVNVLVRTPAAQWPQCEHPLLSLPSNARQWATLASRFVAASKSDLFKLRCSRSATI